MPPPFTANSSHITIAKLDTFVRVLFFFWTLLILTSCIHTIYNRKQSTKDIALAEARMAYQKDIIYRKWATSHGGVYVPVDAMTTPNPNLAHVPERDITTLSGRQLTLMNPAYITRKYMIFRKTSLDQEGISSAIVPCTTKTGPTTGKQPR